MNGFSQISGLMHVDDAYLDHIYGTISASGLDSMGNATVINGTFMAPSCGSFKP